METIEASYEGQPYGSISNREHNVLEIVHPSGLSSSQMIDSMGPLSPTVVGNARELADIFFDCLLEIDLDTEEIITREQIWGILLHFVGEENIQKLQAWLGKTIKQRTINEKIRQLLQVDIIPKQFESTVKKTAENWFAEQEKNKQQTMNSKRLIHFVKIRHHDTSTVLSDPSVQQLCKLLGKDPEEFIFTEEQIDEFQNEYKKWMDSVRLKSDQVKVSQKFNNTNSLNNKRKFKRFRRDGEDYENGEEFDSSYPITTFPYIQLVEGFDHFKMIVHVPNLEGNLRVMPRAQSVVVVGRCFTLAMEKDEKLLYSNFHSGDFAREIYFPVLVDKSSIKKEGDKDTWRIIINKLQDEPVIVV